MFYRQIHPFGGGQPKKGKKSMSDYISKSALIQALRISEDKPMQDTEGFIDGYVQGWNDVVSIIELQPTIDEEQ